MRFTRSTNKPTERDLSLATIEEIRGNASDQALRHQGGLEIQEYEEINLPPHQDPLELQGNVAYAGVGLQYHSQAALKPTKKAKSEVLELQENVAYAGVGLQCHSQAALQPKKTKSGLQRHHEVLELVAYQRPSRQQECSGFPVYEVIN